MSKCPDNFLFAKTHEWVSCNDDEAIVGVSDYAQQQLGDLVFVELPSVGKDVACGDEVAVLESVKTAADVYSPVSGVVTEVNPELASDPSLINKAPYGDAWLYKIKLHDSSELEELYSAQDYAEQV